MRFTLKRLLISTGLIAMGIAGAMLPWRLSYSQFNPEYAPLALTVAYLTFVFSSGAFICGGIGYLSGRFWLGVTVGYAAAVFFMSIWYLYAIYW